MNPRAAVNDLLPFQGSPFGQLGYFSKLSYLPVVFGILFYCCHTTNTILTHVLCIVKHFFQLFQKFFKCLTNGESGIRTHAPLRTNGFQDRLVMTTSISLHMLFSAFILCCFVSACCILSPFIGHVNNIFHFFYIFLSEL